jgi:hypothetical protein
MARKVSGNGMVKKRWYTRNATHRKVGQKAATIGYIVELEREHMWKQKEPLLLQVRG